MIVYIVVLCCELYNAGYSLTYPTYEQEKPTNCGTKAADELANCLAGKL